MFLAIIVIVLLVLILLTLVFILNALRKRPLQQKIEIPKIEIPKIELPKIEIPRIEVPKIELPKIEIPHIEVPKIELPKIELPKIEIPHIENLSAAGGSDLAPVINELAKTLQETSELMRVNQAEFQSGLSAFHKAIDKLLTQIPSGDKELNAQKEFMQKFEEAMRISQESATEAMNENSLRLQEILAEVLNKEAK